MEIIAISVGDVVRIVRQPENMIVHVEGEVGEVIAVKDGWCEFNGVNLRGDVSGGGCIPLDCVRPEDRPEWLAAVERRRAFIRELIEDGRKRQALYDVHATKVAAKFGIPAKYVHDIVDEMKHYDDHLVGA